MPKTRCSIKKPVDSVQQEMEPRSGLPSSPYAWNPISNSNLFLHDNFSDMITWAGFNVVPNFCFITFLSFQAFTGSIVERHDTTPVEAPGPPAPQAPTQRVSKFKAQRMKQNR